LLRLYSSSQWGRLLFRAIGLLNLAGLQNRLELLPELAIKNQFKAKKNLTLVSYALSVFFSLYWVGESTPLFPPPAGKRRDRALTRWKEKAPLFIRSFLRRREAWGAQISLALLRL